MAIIEKLLTGPDAADSLSGVASLRIEIFREYPYLYDGKRDDEVRYLKRYAEKPGACVITVCDGDTPAGAATGIPLQYEHRTMVDPVRATDYPIDEIYYVGEVLFYPAYRNRGLGHRVLAMIERHVRAPGGFRYLACATVVRPDDHPLRPPGYVSIERFLTRTGFKALPGASSTITWRETDGSDHSHPMRFWIKELVMPWQVWRQDDNGNRFLVDSFPSRELADRRIVELTQGHHKQTYWICETGDHENAAASN